MTCAEVLYQLLSYGPAGAAKVRKALRERGFSDGKIDAAITELDVRTVGRPLGHATARGSYKLPKTPRSYTKRPKILHAAPRPTPRRRRIVYGGRDDG